ncbi:hypothetical protein Ae505Ps2_0746 [Pseudonocardia sp. Ae505_Ps2]|nr:hypothetical protein Ae505Ps2_0746 [Pseudonocardia sp. Ae505_Ps2]
MAGPAGVRADAGARRRRAAGPLPGGRSRAATRGRDLTRLP